MVRRASGACRQACIALRHGPPYASIQRSKSYSGPSHTAVQVIQRSKSYSGPSHTAVLVIERSLNPAACTPLILMKSCIVSHVIRMGAGPVTSHRQRRLAYDPTTLHYEMRPAL
jgi:hypothetical protein